MVKCELNYQLTCDFSVIVINFVRNACCWLDGHEGQVVRLWTGGSQKHISLIITVIFLMILYSPSNSITTRI